MTAFHPKADPRDLPRGRPLAIADRIQFPERTTLNSGRRTASSDGSFLYNRAHEAQLSTLSAQLPLLAQRRRDLPCEADEQQICWDLPCLVGDMD